jgi:hypothetical protein
MNKFITLFLLAAFTIAGSVSAADSSITPKKKSSLEKRMKKQNKKKQKKGDQGCPRIDC